MSKRRVHMRLDDGTSIELTWEQSTTKFVLEIEEHPAQPASSSAETAKPTAVSPESPAVTEERSVLEQQRRNHLNGEVSQ